MHDWVLYYHITWTTQGNACTLKKDAWPTLNRVMVHAGKSLGAKVFAVNCLPEHVHLAASIPPEIAVHGWIMNVQAAAVKAIDQPIAWSPDYRVVSFTRTHLQDVVQYVKLQRTLHKDGTLIPLLECASITVVSPQTILT